MSEPVTVTRLENGYLVEQWGPNNTRYSKSYTDLDENAIADIKRLLG